MSKKAEQFWIDGTKPVEPDEHPELNAIAMRIRAARAAKKEAGVEEKEGVGDLVCALSRLGLDVYKFRDDDGCLVTVTAEQETKVEIKTIGGGRSAEKIESEGLS